MKKLSVVSAVLIFSLVIFTSCAKKAAGPEPGSAKVNEMLNLLPKDVQAVFFVDLHKAISTDFVDKELEKEKSQEEYQEFVDETGIDPKTDIYFITGAMKGFGKTKQKGAIIVNLKYDKETLLAKIRQEEGELKEEDYNGFTIYSAGKKEDENAGAFLDDSNIVLGSSEGVRATIDTYQKKTESVLKNEELAPLIKQTNQDALFWATVLIPPEALEQATSANPMLSSFVGINAASLYFDYKNKNIIAEIKVMGGDEAKNQQIVDVLNGFKTMGAMASTKDPNVGLLLEKIEISSSADHVKVYANVPEDLISKLSSKKEVTTPEK